MGDNVKQRDQVIHSIVSALEGCRAEVLTELYNSIYVRKLEKVTEDTFQFTDEFTDNPNKE